jgi:hypothetical protein
MRDTRVAWVVALAALLLALAAGALVGSALLRESPFWGRPVTPLVPTGVEVLSPDSGVYDRVIVDGRGAHWAVGPGRVARFDPSGRDRSTWTVADDAAFSSSTIASARAGGLWVASGTGIARFDGTGFREAIPAPAPSLTDLLEAPDGTMWAVPRGDAPLRWDGSRWASLPEGRPTKGADLLLVTRGGDVWVSDVRVGDAGPVGEGVSRLAGARWTTWNHLDAKPLGGSILAIEEAADGSIWVVNAWVLLTRDPGLARFDGAAWAAIDGPGFQVEWLEAAPDGSMWATSAGGGPLVARYRDGAWTRWDRGLPPTGTDVGRVSETASGTFLATNHGLHRLVGDRWEPAWPDAADGPGEAGGAPFGYVTLQGLVAVSADEAWAADSRGAWHYLDGRWEGPTQPEPFKGKWISSIAVGPDGAVWLAGQAGVAVLRNGAWTMALDDDARTVVVTPDGTAWVGRQSPGIVRLRRSGTGFTTESVSCPVGAMSMVAAVDGSVWLGSFAYAGSAGLAHFDGRTCAMVDVLGDGRLQEVVAIVAGPGGRIAAELLEDTRASQVTEPARWTSRLVKREGGHWAVLEQLDDVIAPRFVLGGSLVFDQSGDLWGISLEQGGGGLERFDGKRRVPGASGLSVGGPMTFAPDGSLWSTGPAGIQRIPASRLAAD